jgi:thymidylate synthase
VDDKTGIKMKFNYITEEPLKCVRLEKFPQVPNFNMEEDQYLKIIYEILTEGIPSNDRTETGTIKVFGRTMRFTLTDSDGKLIIPLFTTGFTSFKLIVEELLWFIKGGTNSKELEAKNNFIWKKDSSKETLRKRNLPYEEGELGPIYGFQWTNWGGSYGEKDGSGTKGINQLHAVIEGLKNDLKTNTEGRRHIITAWNPSDIPKMSLPPCHVLSQFVLCNGKLMVTMYQRSGDMGLGVPFNVASYSLLAHMVAQCVGVEAGEFFHIIIDAHIYNNHIGALKVQLNQEPYPFPTLELAKKDNPTIDSYKFEDFKLINYRSFASLKKNMSY